MATVEQNTLKRRGVGLRAWNPDRASPGFTLFAPFFEENRTVYLIDLHGEVAHTWRMPYRPGLYGNLTERGTLLFRGHVPGQNFLSTFAFKGGVILEADWHGRVLWEVHHPDHHHDAALLRNGNVLLLCLAEVPDEIASRVAGGRPGSEANGKIYGDYLVEITRAGQPVWEWRSWEHLDPVTDGIAEPQADRAIWTHGNAVVELPDGDILVSYRPTSSIVRIHRASGEIVWKLAAPPLAGQHAPTPLENGNLLIFDNGPHRLDDPLPFSRVIEVNPETKDLVWTYQDNPVSNFFSPRISNAQRLPNGNTRINEGWFGRFFEVTSEGEVVWEYVSPYFGPYSGGPSVAESNRVFRVYRYTPEEIERARSTV